MSANSSRAPESLAVRSPRVIPLPDFGISVFESRHAPGFEGRLKDDFSKFFFVLAGQAIWKAAGKSCMLEADSFVHVPAGMEHHQVDVEGNAVTLYALHYRSDLLLREIRVRLEGEGLAHWNTAAVPGGLTRFLRGCFQEMLYEQHLQKEGWETVLCARLLEMAARSVRLLNRRREDGGVSANRDWGAAERVAQYVRSQQTRFYRQETLDEAAHSVGLSRRQFTTLFREVAGESWLEHRLKLRLEHTIKLLRQSENSIIAIAFEAGFEDLSNFNRAFKQAYGCAPKVYREKVRC